VSLVGFPFVSLLPTFLGVPSRPISIVFRALVVLLSLWMLARWIFGRRLFCARPAVWALLAFWILLVSRITWEATVVPLPLNLRWNDYYLFGIGVALLPCLALLEVPTHSTVRRALRLTEAMGVPAVVGLSVVGFNAAFTGEVESSRLTTDTVNAAYIGYMGVIVVTLSVLSMVYAAREGRSTPWSVGFRVFSVLIGLTAMVASVSKGPVLVAFITAILLTITLRKGQVTSGSLVMRAGLLAVVIAGVVAGAFVLEEYTSLRMISRFTQALEDQSTLERTQMLTGAFEQFSRSPIIGDDIVELRSQTYPHNVLLEALMTNGIIGFALLCVVAGASAGSAAKILFAGDGREWLALVYAQFWLLGMVAGSLVFTPHIWAVTAAILAASATGGTQAQRAGPTPITGAA
jgi:O-antigen ligase